MIQPNSKSLVGGAMLQYRFNYSKIEKSDFELRREILLEKLRSPAGKYKYKRYINGTPLRYAGGKNASSRLDCRAITVQVEKNSLAFFRRRLI